MDESDQQQKCKSAISVASGCIFAASWWMWIDANAYQNALQLTPSVLPAYYVPGIFATFGLIMTQLAPVETLNPSSFMSFASASVSSRVRLWLFLSFAVSFGAIISAIWVMATAYLPPGQPVESQWPGVALTLQTVGIFMASMLLMYGKMQTAEYDSV